jgi:hypothetical protein
MKEYHSALLAAFEGLDLPKALNYKEEVYGYMFDPYNPCDIFVNALARRNLFSLIVTIDELKKHSVTNQLFLLQRIINNIEGIWFGETLKDPHHSKNDYINAYNSGLITEIPKTEIDRLLDVYNYSNLKLY